MSDDIKVLGISGSLQRLLQQRGAAGGDRSGSAGHEHRVGGHLRHPAVQRGRLRLGFRPPVERFREQIRAADALLFATPEYNYSMAGVLENAIDWASRPPEQLFSGKPAAILGASAGRSARAGAVSPAPDAGVLDVHPLNKPEVIFQRAERLRRQGRLLDDKARELIQQQLQAQRYGCAACAVECLVTGEPEHEQYRKSAATCPPRDCRSAANTCCNESPRVPRKSAAGSPSVG